MKVGLDFDGVLSDCGQLKSDGAKKLFGVYIPPEKFKKELVIGSGQLSLEQYRLLQSQIYGNYEIGMTMQPVKGVLEFLPKMMSNGYDLTVITSRGEPESKIAKDWLQKHNIEIKIIAVGGGRSKAEACKGLNAYIDDDIQKLEPLVGIVPYRYLFSWGYNEHIMVGKETAKRINSWRDFFNELEDIKVSLK